jgi:oligopeptide transport system ATP-binding protein
MRLMSDERAPIMDLRGVFKRFPIRAGLFRRTVGHVHAVNGVDLQLFERETLGIVGESGCGKSTLGRTMLRLIEPTEGQILYRGENLVGASKSRMRELRRDLQIVFQDPYASLNPRMPVREIIGEPLVIHGASRAEVRSRVAALLEAVGLLPEHANRYPHEFSGGQRQRIGIARALALRPKVVVLDEPVSALDVSIQAQVLNLLEDLQDELELSMIFIAHDLSVVRHISERIAVMYLGRVVEIADRDDLYEAPAHPYTHSLLSAVPVADPRTERARQRVVLQGDVPSPARPPSGCTFHPRCPVATDVCSREVPELSPVGANGQLVACHHPFQRGETLEVRIRSGSRV